MVIINGSSMHLTQFPKGKRVQNCTIRCWAQNWSSVATWSGRFESPSKIKKVLNAGGACKKNVNNDEEGVAILIEAAVGVEDDVEDLLLLQILLVFLAVVLPVAAVVAEVVVALVVVVIMVSESRGCCLLCLGRMN